MEIGLELIYTKQKESLFGGAAALFRNETNSINSSQISRILADLENIGLISCVELVETTNKPRIFYDTTSQSNCGIFSNKTEGNLTSINGATWKLSLSSPMHKWIFFLRILLIVAIVSFHYLVYLFMRKQKRIQDLKIVTKEIEKDLLLDINRQTSHDIASPLMALKIISQKIDASEEYKVFLGEVYTRIEGILSSLTSPTSNTVLSTFEIGRTISQVIKEKILERNLDSSTFSVSITNIEVLANEKTFMRVVSNILNNSLEAIPKGMGAKIEITSEVIEGNLVLKIRDNGIGMSPETLTKIGIKGFTYEKDGIAGGGNGLGVHYAQQALNAWKGSLRYESSLGSGTTAIIEMKVFT